MLVLLVVQDTFFHQFHLFPIVVSLERKQWPQRPQTLQHKSQNGWTGDCVHWWESSLLETVFFIFQRRTKKFSGTLFYWHPIWFLDEGYNKRQRHLKAQAFAIKMRPRKETLEVNFVSITPPCLMFGCLIITIAFSVTRIACNHTSITCVFDSDWPLPVPGVRPRWRGGSTLAVRRLWWQLPHFLSDSTPAGGAQGWLALPKVCCRGKKKSTLNLIESLRMYKFDVPQLHIIIILYIDFYKMDFDNFLN